MEDLLYKWRLILGDKADPDMEIQLDGAAAARDKTLGVLYDSDRKGGLGSSAPRLNRWLGDIRKYFPQSVVQVIQRDAIQKIGLAKMLADPDVHESLVPDIHLVSTLLQLKNALPEQTRQTAREVVRKLVEDLQKKLKFSLIQRVQGALNRSVFTKNPKFKDIHWQRTIRKNLKHYQKDYKTIIPETLIGYGRKGEAIKHLYLVVDQSGSMAGSVVYAGILGSVLASIPSLKTEFYVFDTSIVDLSEKLYDPVDLLFATQLGGGTDIHKALAFTRKKIEQPANSIVVLISDMFEGGNVEKMLAEADAIRKNGSKMIVLLALSDEGAPVYDHHNAKRINDLDIACFACTPDQFPEEISKLIEK